MALANGHYSIKMTRIICGDKLQIQCTASGTSATLDADDAALPLLLEAARNRKMLLEATVKDGKASPVHMFWDPAAD